ncbi:phosphate regulon sensor histidine kinase PhoR [Pseudomonas sp.]|uniref:phosphate regulon sensor histidine kinase PhoR n=1 Tax=Pseudomonas sp. TaxID=306 RepID=UPI0019F109AA|nr:phosphate regulon sensor histidine kinase PhoR [Pseudomonas sp.]MBF0677249.1 phosphate regulon sensor histidine kinase PhoR [Pseudomonas sp.]
MNSDWRSVLFRHMALLVGTSLLLGLFTKAWGWSVALCLAAYLAWLLTGLLRLRHWLEHAEPDDEVPHASGLWEELYDRIHYQKRRSRQARDRLQAVINRAQKSTAALKDAVVMLDRDGNLEWWNPAARTLLGLTAPQDTGQAVTNLIRHPRFKDYFDRQNFHDPLELPSPINPQLQLQFFITLYGQSEHLMVVRDVTRLQLLEQMRKDFVANVSHELRTPLTVITGYLETLLDNVDQINPRWLRPMQQMQQQAGRMQNLLNDLLMLARLEATDYPSDNQPVAVDLLLLSIRADAQALSGERQHRISLEADPHLKLKGSESELRSAFSNLVFNAVKYTPDEGEIQIRWWGNEQGAHLSVQDSGIGIEPRHISRLTERFYRVDASRASDTGGTGLGLAIVKHVLLRHHGRLDVISTVGQGSTFTCHFPHNQLVQRNAPNSRD